jgi:hypothetical protein
VSPAYDLPQSVGQKKSGGSSWLLRRLRFGGKRDRDPDSGRRASIQPELGHPFAFAGCRRRLSLTFFGALGVDSGVGYSPKVTAAARAAIVNGRKVGAIVAAPWRS